MAGHVRHALAVDIYLAAISQALHVLGAGVGTRAIGDDVFGFHGVLLDPSPSPVPQGWGRGMRYSPDSSRLRRSNSSL